MRTPRLIWNHETQQAVRIAKTLAGSDHKSSTWRVIIFPLALADRIRSRKTINEISKNILFTKELAFNAARRISEGSDRAMELGTIDLKTREVLKHEQKGFYTEKIRKKQLSEISLLIDHYLKLINAQGTRYEELLREAYMTRKDYRTFIDELEQREADVIESAVSTMRKGSKKERVAWFKKLREASREIRIEILDRVFPAH